MEMIRSILTNILMALYQPFLVSVTLTIMVSFFYLYAYNPINAGKGVRQILKAWYQLLRTSLFFRRFIFLDFYGVLILCKTLYYRSIWINPLQDVIGGWWIWKVSSSTGEIVLTTECFENMLLMAPFTFLLFLTFANKFASSKDLKNVACLSIKISFVFSFSIELVQLVFRVGTWQLSDLFYNTLGGFIGGTIYWFYMNVKLFVTKNRKERRETI